MEGNADEGWVELLANGLTFDVNGLAPHRSAHIPEPHHRFGLSQDLAHDEFEAVTIMPGPHLLAGGTMFPVVRGVAQLAAWLTELRGAKGVLWHPAHALSEADYFRRSVTGWIAGGAFPGLGLTALSSMPDGSLQSEGLALFTGQELLIPADIAGDGSEGAKIALRLINWLVEHGRVEQEFTFTGPSGEPIGVEPVENSAMLRVWRGSL